MSPDSRNPPYLDSCLEKRLLFFTGKGGVGKSTLAWAVARACAHRGKKVLFIHWNPYQAVNATLTAGSGSVEMVALDTLSCFKEYVLMLVKFEKLYDVVFENHVLKTFVRVAPGLSDTVIAGKIWDLYSNHPADMLIVDLPASGHALSFFQSPMGVHKMFRLGFIHEESRKICDMFLSPKTRIDIVSLPEELPMQEAKELKEKLLKLSPFPFGYLVVNQALPDLVLETVPKELTPGLRKTLENYIARKKNERDALSLATGLEMPQISIPRFPTESLLGTIELTTQHLEKA